MDLQLHLLNVYFTSIADQGMSKPDGYVHLYNRIIGSDFWEFHAGDLVIINHVMRTGPFTIV